MKELRDAVHEMREANPGWGPLTILTELGEDEHFKHLKLPRRSRVAAYLNEKEFTRKYERHLSRGPERPSGLTRNGKWMPKA